MFCLPIKALGLLVSVIAQQPSLIQLEVEENKPLLVNKKQQTICEEIFYLNMTYSLKLFCSLVVSNKGSHVLPSSHRKTRVEFHLHYFALWFT